MDEFKTIEKTSRQSLNFIEQLQDQIELCRKGLSDLNVAISLKVETLESLLWAKLKDDKEYKETIKELDELTDKKISGI